MPAGTAAVSFRRSSYRRILLAGASLLALVAGGGGAEAGTLSQAVATAAAGVASSSASVSATASAVALNQAQQQAQAQAAGSLKAALAAQVAARNLAAAATTKVTDGLSAGGLIIDPRVGTSAGTTADLWVNADLPTQATSDGQTTVTINQTAQRAVMTWQQFNVGKNTTLYYNQSAGNSTNGNSWVALNRIDATGVPSQIQGRIKAEGTVLLINPNGIVFSGTSQINVHTLIAAAMDINSYSGGGGSAFNAVGSYTQVAAGVLAPISEGTANKAFLDSGLYVNGVSSSGAGTLVFSTPDTSIAGQNAGIQVQAGATITTGVSGFDNGGLVALIGPQVTNAGQIATSAGQIILAAGNSVLLTEPASTQTSLTVSTLAPVGQSLVYAPSSVSGGAFAVNDTTGVLTATRGNITLVGDTVEQLGVAQATTSITRAGSITIAATGASSAGLGAVIFGAGSSSTILPEENGETIPSDATSLKAFQAPTIAISTANMDMKPGSLILAPGAQMSVITTTQSTVDPVGRVLLENGSTIDLAGLTGVTRSVSDYLYTFKVTANDVADSPLAQSLIGQTVTIDLSLTGTRADGETWVGSPLFASSGAGYLANITQKIDQLLTKGGSLTIGAGTAGIIAGTGATGATTAFRDVVSAPGSVIDVSGGWIQFTGATVKTTKLWSTDGRLYDIGSADPFVAYSGIGGSTTVTHSRWGVTETYTSPLLTRGIYKAGYIDGVSAGSVTETAANPILEGDILGDITIGAHQRALAQTGTGTNGAQATPDQLPSGAGLALTLTGANVVLDSTAPDVLGPSFTLGSPALSLPTITYSTDLLSSENFSTISISGAGTLSMAKGASLSVRPGGSIILKNVTTLDGRLIAHAGTISLTGFVYPDYASVPALGDIVAIPLTIGADALLDVSGLWVNDSGLDGAALQGSAFINGGTVSLSTALTSAKVGAIVNNSDGTHTATAQDETASIILAAGSVIDLSSGGYVGTNGILKTGTDGLPVGNGGNLSLKTYAGGSWASDTYTDQAQYPFAPRAANAASVILDGAIHAGGLNKGGTFTLQAPAVTIDGTATAVTTIPSGTLAGTVVLPTSFFASGFSAYDLISTYGGVTVTAGTTVVLKQQNYLISTGTVLPASGASVRDFTSFGSAPDGLRQPVNLTLIQQAFEYGAAGDPSGSAGITIGGGASVVADPQAAVTLTANGSITVLGSIIAPAGSITLTNQNASLAASGSTLATSSYLAAQDIWIGADALLDVSGVFVPNPQITAYATGSALDAGSITLSSDGAIVALAGSRFDLAGASGSVQLPSGGTALRASSLVTQDVWSNGGTLTLYSSTSAVNLTTGSVHSLYFGGTIHAAGGAAGASGGTLNIGQVIPSTDSNGVVSYSLAGYDSIVIAQSGDDSGAFATASAPTTRSVLLSLLPTTGSAAFLTADTLSNSGLASVSLTGTTIGFSGNVTLTVPGALSLNGNIALLPAGITPSSALSAYAAATTASGINTIGAPTVALNAGYIRWINGIAVVPSLADGTLTLNAGAQIDLAGVVSVSNATAVTLISGGDIRFLNTNDSDIRPYLTAGVYSRASNGYAATSGSSLTSDGAGGMPSAGALLVPDDLTLSAREIYPATDTAFLLMSLGSAPSTASGTHNAITFAANGATPSAPLSAGGAILVDAKSIVQGGALYAPLGTIQLGYGVGQTLPAFFIGSANAGANNSYDPVGNVNIGLFSSILPILATKVGTTDTVTTGSVTLASGSLTSTSAAGLSIPYGTTTDGTTWTDGGIVLNGPPAKLIVLAGTSVVTESNAKIDESGGGDVYATEFVAGTGGSRNVLTTASQTVYALVPSYAASVAAYDPTFGTTVAAGTSVTLAGGNGVAAGTYTLLPAMYATVPGAYRVVVVSTGTGTGGAINAVTADGSIYMTGTLTNAVTGAKSSQTALLQIQPKATWTRYSEIDIASGNSYFTALAAANGTATPRLAQDAGHLIIAAGNALTLAATNSFAPATGGRGGQVDITGTNLLVVAADLRQSFLANAAYNGTLFLDADQISNLGVESVLIGGTRASTTSGTLITASALNLEVDTDAAHALSGPDLLLVTKAGGTGLAVDPGSAITAKGTVSSASGDGLIFGVANSVGGDGSLLRVSNGGIVTVTRRNLPATTAGALTVGAGSVISGNALTLDSSGTAVLADSATLLARNYDLAANVINIGGGTTGLVLTDAIIAQFAGADSVSLRSASVFNVYGAVALGGGVAPIGQLTFDGAGFGGDGWAATVTATNITLENSRAVAFTNGAGGGGGSLTLDATNVLTFGAGTMAASGFATLVAGAGTEMLFSGTGSLDAKAANVALTAPVLIAAAGSSQTLTTTGSLTIVQGAGTVPALKASDIGGALTLKAGAINDGGTIVAQGGTVTLEATAGDVTLAGSAAIRAPGTRITLFDAVEDTPAGTVTLTSDLGNVALGAGTTIDVSAAGNGYAGTVKITAVKGQATLNGTLAATAASNALGGTFILNAKALAGSLPLTAFTGAFEVELGSGDIAIAAGQTLTSANVLLQADAGSVLVNGTIDASGSSGGIIELFGTKGVDLEGSLLARASSATQLGGTVEIGTSGTPTPDSYNPAYGYENVASANSGTITIGAGALIDVSGGTRDGLSGGTILLRAPLLDNGGVNVVIAPSAQFVGSRATTLEAYAVWSTADKSQADQTKYFDGVIDPAGWYDSSGTLLSGIFLDGNGNLLATWDGSNSLTAAQRTADLANDYFFPLAPPPSGDTIWFVNPANGNFDASWDGTTLTNSDGTTNPLSYYIAHETPSLYDGNGNLLVNTLPTYNTNHQSFYGYAGGVESNGAGTLMGFVRSPGFAAVANTAGIANFHEAPGIELRNPTAANVNGGKISVLTNWNLGAENSTTLAPVYRTSDGQAPILSIRAGGDVAINASITDGFTGSTRVLIWGNYNTALNDYSSNSSAFSLSTFRSVGFDSSYDLQSLANFGTNNGYYYYYGQYVTEYGYYYNGAVTGRDRGGLPGWDFSRLTGVLAPSSVTDLYPAAPTSLSGYAAYLTAYNIYLNAYISWASSVGHAFTLPVQPSPPPQQSLPTISYFNTFGAGSDPAPVASATLLSPIGSMAPASEASSSSYRIAAGAVFGNANPLAVATNGPGDVIIDGHISYTDPQTAPDGVTHPTISVGTVVRTGTGSIDIAAAGSFVLADTTVPGAVYTAGTAATTPSDFTAPSVSTTTTSNGLVSTPSWGTGGGSVTVTAGQDIVCKNGTVACSVEGATNWSSWYYHAILTNNTSIPFSSTQQTAAWINYATYGGGIGALGGGNVTLTAGGSITDIVVSLPETIAVGGGVTASDMVKHTYGGGDLRVTAGGGIVGGGFLVGQGSGLIRVGGAVTADSAGNAPELAVQDGAISVIAQGAITLGGIDDPAELDNFVAANAYTIATALPGGGGTGTSDTIPLGKPFTSYGADSGVFLTSLAGDVTLAASSSGSALLPSSLTQGGAVLLLPASLGIDAVNGGIQVNSSLDLIPSSGGTLSLIAGGSISTVGLLGASVVTYSVSMMDGTSANDINPLGTPAPTVLASALHAGDTNPAIIYAGQDITGAFGLIKPAKVEAGRDIVNLTFTGQNNSAADLTSIIAGRDILARTTGLDSNGNVLNSVILLTLYGPGDFLVEAGRNLGPFTTYPAPTTTLAATQFSANGIFTVGDGSNCATVVCNGVVKSYLPVAGANITALFGVGSGLDYAAAIHAYVDPAQAATGRIDFLTDIAAILGESETNAWATFQTLSPARQKLLVERAFLDFLTQVGLDYNNAASPYHNQYARAYTAISTLFPASLGYTNNDTGGSNGASATVHTGDLRIAHSLIETQTGGDIALLGPGGNMYVGSNSADTLQPNQQGILTLQGGTISGYTDGSVLVYQSRVFTEQGGDVDLFSANGDLNAGKGKKSSASYPKLTLVCDVDGYCRVSPSGLVTGAGIGALLSVPGQDPLKSNANLTTPHGTVDAGAAGIRAAGNLNIVALHVLNAFNIDVGGKATGVPAAAAPNLGALTAASDTAGASASAADAASRNSRQTGPRQTDLPSIITIEVIGYGGAAGELDPATEKSRRARDRQSRYDAADPVRVVGYGPLNAADVPGLTEEEKRKLAQP